MRGDIPESIVTEFEVIEQKSDEQIGGDFEQRRASQPPGLSDVPDVRHQKTPEDVVRRYRVTT